MATSIPRRELLKRRRKSYTWDSSLRARTRRVDMRYDWRLNWCTASFRRENGTMNGEVAKPVRRTHFPPTLLVHFQMQCNGGLSLSIHKFSHSLFSPADDDLATASCTTHREGEKLFNNFSSSIRLCWQLGTLYVKLGRFKHSAAVSNSRDDEARAYLIVGHICRLLRGALFWRINRCAISYSEPGRVK